MYVLFPQYPDAVFRAAYQATGASTTPFVLVSFERSEDKEEDIATFMNSLKSYFADSNTGI